MIKSGDSMNAIMNRLSSDIIKGWLIAFLGGVVCVVLMAIKADLQQPDLADSRDYLAGAYNLAHHGVFSQDKYWHLDGSDTKPVAPGIGREPGWAYVLSWLIRLDQNGIGQINLECLSADEGCGFAPYQSAQWLNRLFFAGAGICLFWAAFRIFSSLKLATVAGAAIWLNLRMQKNMDQVVSDPLALFLVAGLVLAFVFARTTGSVWRSRSLMIVAGFLLGALILTKAVYLYFLYSAVVLFILWAVAAWFRSRSGESGGRLCKAAFPAALFFICAAIGPGLWMHRNADLDGRFSLSDSREGIALSVRLIYNDMTHAEYVAAFVYWTAGFGDSLARAIFPPEAIARFSILAPDGFYLKGHLNYHDNVKRLIAERGVTPLEAEEIWIDNQRQQKHQLRHLSLKAEEIWTDHLKGEILSQPFRHLWVTLPLVYRGLNSDPFIILSLPGLIFLLWQALRRQDDLILIALSPGLFNIIFYALVSLNIKRYQITAMPTLALGLAGAFLAIAIIREWMRNRRHAPGQIKTADHSGKPIRP